MAQNKFFKAQGPFSIEKLSHHARIDRVVGDDQIEISDIAPLSIADSSQLGFLDNYKYKKDLSKTKAAAVIVREDALDEVPDGCVALISGNPHLSFALASQLFYPLPEIVEGVHDRAIVDSSASVGKGTQVEAGAWIGPNVIIGENCYIGPNVVINEGVEIGAHSRIGANASLEYCLVGMMANIHPGVRIGTRGFGFAIDPSGFVDVPQTGQVVIGHQVEIGANSVVDRGMGHDTVIGDGCKIDNMIHIGHNVKMGKGCVMAAMSGIAGSTELGDFVLVGAQAGFSGHLKIGSKVQVSAKSGVTKNLEDGAIVGGFPAEPVRQWRRRHATVTKLMKKKG